jgi:hypothetical protein
MEELQEYLVAVDQMKFTRRMPEYGEVFTRKLQKTLARTMDLFMLQNMKVVS